MFAITGFVAVFTKCPDGSAFEEVGLILFGAFFDPVVFVSYVAIFNVPFVDVPVVCRSIYLSRNCPLISSYSLAWGRVSGSFLDYSGLAADS